MTPVDSPNGRLCFGCGGYLDPAAAAGADGTPNVYNRHPGCERRPQLRLIQGDKR